uniref:Uncharacterized protein n=1 Tax=Glossina palpalis gambiensis TaxID=67801 RepID=A0A1B0BF89_9MUSC
MNANQLSRKQKARATDTLHKGQVLIKTTIEVPMSPALEQIGKALAPARYYFGAMDKCKCSSNNTKRKSIFIVIKHPQDMSNSNYTKKTMHEMNKQLK